MVLVTVITEPKKSAKLSATLSPRLFHPPGIAAGATARENLVSGPRTSFADNLVERLLMRDCPVNKLCVHILSNQNLLRRAGLLLSPRYIPRRLLLKHVEDLSGNLYYMFTHLYPFRPIGLE
jgi:hypothetical protein